MITVVLVLLFAIMIFTGGHDPRRHIPFSGVMEHSAHQS